MNDRLLFLRTATITQQGNVHIVQEVSCANVLTDLSLIYLVVPLSAKQKFGRTECIVTKYLSNIDHVTCTALAQGNTGVTDLGCVDFE